MVRKNYAKTTYSFMPDRLVYYDGFFNRAKKEIKYSAILEIGYTEGIFQRMYDLGSINLSTSATAASNKQHAGIVLLDVEKTEEHFLKFKKLYDYKSPPE